jgi:hypothetical protein
MPLIRLPALWISTALATLTLPLPEQDSKSRPPRTAPPDQPEAAAVRFQTSPPPARIDWNGGWSATEQRIEQDVERYRSERSERLESLALAIDGLGKRCDREPFATRPYLRTRVQALRQHLDYAREELVKLPGSQSEESFTPTHAHFYRTLSNLQDAFSQAADEMNDQS